MKLVGTSEAYIREYESSRHNPKPKSLETIAKTLSVNLEVLTNSNFDVIKAIHRHFQVFWQYDGCLNIRSRRIIIWLLLILVLFS